MKNLVLILVLALTIGLTFSNPDGHLPDEVEHMNDDHDHGSGDATTVFSEVEFTTESNSAKIGFSLVSGFVLVWRLVWF